MHIDPGPIPTLIMSAPELYNFFAASPVAIFPTHIGIFFIIFFTLFNVLKTFSLCPWAVSITIKSTPFDVSDLALSISSSLVPIAAPTKRFLRLTF